MARICRSGRSIVDLDGRHCIAVSALAECLNHAPVIEPTLKLFNAARAKGVSVFFITGRDESERAAAIRNLHRAG
jgi:hypothetical protein